MALAASRTSDDEDAGAAAAADDDASDDSAGDAKKEDEVEGVFVVRDGKAVFVPVSTGIAGEKYFEVLEGLEEGDEVVTGNFAALRKLKDGDAVKMEKKDKDAKDS